MELSTGLELECEAPPIAVVDRHVEAAGARCQHAADAAHPQDAEMFAKDLEAVELRCAPAWPGAAADQVDALGRAPSGAEQQKHSGLGDGLAQHIRQAEHCDPARAGCG